MAAGRAQRATKASPFYVYGQKDQQFMSPAQLDSSKLSTMCIARARITSAMQCAFGLIMRTYSIASNPVLLQINRLGAFRIRI